MKVWDRAGIKLVTPGSAVRFATNCTTQLGGGGGGGGGGVRYEWYINFCFPGNFIFVLVDALHHGQNFHSSKYIFIVWMKNCVGPDQPASSGAC